jgi:hypothetical protein
MNAREPYNRAPPGHQRGRSVVLGRTGVPAFRAVCTALGAIDVRGPGDAGYDTHVHSAWP